LANAIEVKVPDLGNVSDVAVIEVLVKSGDTIQAEQTLITLESDKASMEIPATASGIVKEVKLKVGDKVSQGDVILLLETQQEAKPAPADKVETPVSVNEEHKEQKTQPAPAASIETSKPVNSTAQAHELEAESVSRHGAYAHASPGVRRLAREFGVDLTRVCGSGSRGRVLKEDVQAYVKNALQQTASGSNSGSLLPTAPQVDFSKFGETALQPLTRIKKLTGTNLQRNWLLVPHVTQFIDADITELEAFRKAQQETLSRQGIKLTPLVFIMKAVVAALKAFPQFNASLDASGDNLVLKKYFNLGVAVDTPEGLVVPVIRAVDSKGLLELAQELAAISQKAREKGLSASEMQGGCFTISSLGGIGGQGFTPIVNLPEVAILGVSKAVTKPVYQQGQFMPRLMLPLSLSYDHRVIDGAEGARFAVYLSERLADIRQLLL
jgi:pyruvate dehydrogenase E2 component (dihydrolipoamide acetyltransferase)